MEEMGIRFFLAALSAPLSINVPSAVKLRKATAERALRAVSFKCNDNGKPPGSDEAKSGTKNKAYRATTRPEREDYYAT
ncbi:sodium channel protein type 2 subunit alpha [Anopheles sinensis]|uniref:Sodium channel protein type 2 subunit alpha n=1 Tax=Anopheles sinensis TaxID=74873 RepID=A0A084WJV3_ANOSI|nr:sodium channel protein type 2 subunit alpha [Anopheles sinensis]